MHPAIAIGAFKIMSRRLYGLLLALGAMLFALESWAEPVAMATDVKGTATLTGGKPGPISMLHYFDAPTTVRLAPGSLLVVTYFANPIQYSFKGPALVTIDSAAPRVSEGAPPEVRRVGPEKAIDGGLTRDQWRRLQQATVVMRSARPAFAVISPNQTAILSTRPELSWTPAAGAQSYRLTLSDDNDNAIANWTSTSTTSMVPETAKLAAGKSFRWKVETTDAPQPLVASGVFSIAATDVAHRMIQSRPADGADLAANVFYATLLDIEGFGHDAKAEWRRLARQFPEEGTLQRRATP